LRELKGHSKCDPVVAAFPITEIKISLVRVSVEEHSGITDKTLKTVTTNYLVKTNKVYVSHFMRDISQISLVRTWLLSEDNGAYLLVNKRGFN